jgi:uncharacterized protein YgbK (DUF1537 family)
MSKHPVTPADESDLRLHLGKQTTKTIGLIDVLQQELAPERWNENNGCPEVMLLDALYETQLTKIGAWMDAQYNGHDTLFSVGPSAIEMALGNFWNSSGLWKTANEWKPFAKVSPLLVISGSCSPVTAAQIDWAVANGFEDISLDAIHACNEAGINAEIQDRINDLLRRQKHVIVHTGRKQSVNLSSKKLGTVLGTIAKECIRQTNVKRVIVAGGDTSSYAARAMEIDAVEMIAPLATGAPLCKAFSKNKDMHAVEINFKGGQVGGEDYFGKATGS